MVLLLLLSFLAASHPVLILVLFLITSLTEVLFFFLNICILFFYPEKPPPEKGVQLWLRAPLCTTLIVAILDEFNNDDASATARIIPRSFIIRHSTLHIPRTFNLCKGTL